MLQIREFKTGEELREGVRRTKENLTIPTPLQFRSVVDELQRIKGERDQYRAINKDLKRELEETQKRLAIILGQPPKAKKQVSIEFVMNAVCEFYGIDWSELLSRTRDAEAIMPRHVAMFLCRRVCMPRKSTNQIGREFSRDHTVVVMAERKIDLLRKKNPELNEIVSYLEKLISA